MFCDPILDPKVFHDSWRTWIDFELWSDLQKIYEDYRNIKDNLRTIKL